MNFPASRGQWLEMVSDRQPASGHRWPLRCDAQALPADAQVVDALARVALVARRHGCELWLSDAPAELRELIEFMGLSDVLRHDA
jgi:ABC-type transporter Mla MlaB component